MTTPSLRIMSGDEVKRSLRNRDMDCCCVCLEEHGGDEKYRKLPCNHVLHVECVDTWFKTRVTCPVCKGSVIDLCSQSDKDAGLETMRINQESTLNRNNKTNAITTTTATHEEDDTSPPRTLSSSSTSLTENTCGRRRLREPVLRVASRRHVAYV
eukprot:m.122732 g.122732  ORF g.122732 m.122732 type:complete len:155 (+) comp28939_c1_seq1:470-934(+)